MGNTYACKKCQGTLKKEEKSIYIPFFLSGAVFDHLFIQEKTSPCNSLYLCNCVGISLYFYSFL